MDNNIQTLITYLKNADRQAALSFCMSQITSGALSIPDLYENLLTPALNREDETRSICQEHIETAIVRTIIENCYPYVIKETEKSSRKTNETIALVCPSEEYHDLGIRMAADFMMMLGYNPIFIGANVPVPNILSFISEYKPDMLAISVSNYYHLVSARNMVEEIREYAGYPLKILVGGAAVNEKNAIYKQIGADYYVRSYDDIKNIAEGRGE